MKIEEAISQYFCFSHVLYANVLDHDKNLEYTFGINMYMSI